MEIILNAQEIEILNLPINGSGGFQVMITKFQNNFNHTNSSLNLDEEDIERIPRYAFDYKNGGFEDHLKKIFARNLGANLGR